MQEQIREKVLAAAKDKKLSCKVALGLANELGCSPKMVGDVANEAKIKIAACQLGCFS
jgi:hypothetical protein